MYRGQSFAEGPGPSIAGPSWENSMGGGDGGAGSPSAPSYEQLCRAHVDAFMSAAAAADVQSDLAKRCNLETGHLHGHRIMLCCLFPVWPSSSFQLARPDTFALAYYEV
jgi:hypothetical protein